VDIIINWNDGWIPNSITLQCYLTYGIGTLSLTGCDNNSSISNQAQCTLRPVVNGLNAWKNICVSINGTVAAAAAECQVYNN
jgi:hypothetical protein